MTPADTAQPLQFDTAITEGADPDAPPTPPIVTCHACQQTIPDEYFDVNGRAVCASCRDAIVQHAEPPRGAMPLARAAAFGIGAAIAGAALYYAVIAITNLEIGLVAIAIGYMVGYGIQRATAGRGGRAFQIMAVVLTYWSVGLAYVPLAIFSAPQEEQSAQPSDATDAATATVATPTSTAPPTTGANEVTLTQVIAFLFAISFALPALVVVGSQPGGLISAAIIGFGMHQAWRMTAAPQVAVSGPFRVGTADQAAT